MQKTRSQSQTTDRLSQARSFGSIDLAYQYPAMTLFKRLLAASNTALQNSNHTLYLCVNFQIFSYVQNGLTYILIYLIKIAVLRCIKHFLIQISWMHEM